MMKHRIHIILTFCLLTFLTPQAKALPQAKAQAQSPAEELLKKAAEKYRQSKGVAATFSIETTDNNGSSIASIEGQIHLQDNRFYLEVPDEMKAWFDGQNLWTLLINAQEVNLSTPSQEELLMLNPVNVFMLYQHGFQCQMLKDKTSGKKTLCGVEMRPKEAGSDIRSIRVYFEKSLLQPVSISIVNSNATKSDISITKYQTDRNYPLSFFLFPQKDYPMVEVIDLR